MSKIKIGTRCKRRLNHVTNLPSLGITVGNNLGLSIPRGKERIGF